MAQKSFSDYLYRQAEARGYDARVERFADETAARALDPRSPEQILARYVVAPRRGRRPVPAVCRQFEVEVVKNGDRRTGGSVVAIAKLLDTGESIGRIRATIGSSYLFVRLASMVDGGTELAQGGYDDFSGCGIGTRLYEALAKVACKYRLKMASDTTLYAPSRAFWEKQEFMGRAYFDSDSGRYVLYNACAASKSLSGLKIKTRRRKG